MSGTQVIYLKTGIFMQALGSRLKVEQRDNKIFINGREMCDCDCREYLTVAVLSNGRIRGIDGGNVSVGVSGSVNHVVVNKGYCGIDGRLNVRGYGLYYDGSKQGCMQRDIDSLDDNFKLSYNEADKDFVLYIFDTTDDLEVSCRLTYGQVVVLGDVVTAKSGVSVYVNGNVNKCDSKACIYNKRAYDKMCLSSGNQKFQYDIIRMAHVPDDSLGTDREFLRNGSKRKKPRDKKSFAIMCIENRKFVKSVSLRKNNFALTSDLRNARRFASEYEVHAAMNFLVPLGAQRGLSFMYDVIDAGK